MLRNVSALPHRSHRDSSREVTHRDAVNAALKKAAILDRVDPRGDPYGAAGQALEDYFKRHDQLLVGGEDVSGWISIATERRWINELRYQRRRGYERLDAPAGPDTNASLADMIAHRAPPVEELVEVRELLHAIAGEQRDALAYLRARRVQGRHVRIVELALASELPHHEIAITVNEEFERCKSIQGNTITQIISRQRNRLDQAGTFPTVVARLRRTRHAA
jgi:DNA-directed RNA polymerase specialized sigma24 family protein